MPTCVRRRPTTPEGAMDIAKAKANQLANIEKRSGKSLADLVALVKSSGLRRAKQFACLTPATKTRLDVGIIVKGVEGTDRLVAQPAQAMFPFKVGLTSVSEVDRPYLTRFRHKPNPTITRTSRNDRGSETWISSHRRASPVCVGQSSSLASRRPRRHASTSGSS